MQRGEVGRRRGDPQVMLPISSTDQQWDHRHGAKQWGWGAGPAQIPLTLPIFASFLPRCQNHLKSSRLCPFPSPVPKSP